MSAAKMQMTTPGKMAMPGFTLIELMITVALLGLLLALGLPSFADMVRRNRIQSAASSLSVALATARSEAVKRGRNVSICTSSDSSACRTTGDWSSGWVVFAVAGAPIKAFDPPGGGVTMAGNANLENQLTFLPTGGTTADAEASATVCIPGQVARVVSVAVSGRIRVASGEVCP